MACRPVLRCAAVVAVLAFLLPLGALADSCADCLWAASPDCCPPSCCSCCVHGTFVLIGAACEAPRPALADLASNPPAPPYPSSPARDIFHVPKTAPGARLL